MSNKIIIGEDYKVEYIHTSNLVGFEGELALRTPSEYAPIADLLQAVIQTKSETMTIDLKALKFLNSSGISMLSKFVLSLRRDKTIQLTILGSDDIPWQGKSLKNLQKFLPGLKLQIN